MGWIAPDGLDVPEWRCLSTTRGEASMRKVSTIGLDLAKNAFQVHGADALGPSFFAVGTHPKA